MVTEMAKRKRPLIHFCDQCTTRTVHARNGRNTSGSQRAICVRCSTRITVHHKENRHSFAFRWEARGLYLKQGSFRKTALLLNLHHQTIARWVKSLNQNFPLG